MSTGWNAGQSIPHLDEALCVAHLQLFCLFLQHRRGPMEKYGSQQRLNAGVLAQIDGSMSPVRGRRGIIRVNQTPPKKGRGVVFVRRSIVGGWKVGANR